MSTEVFDLSASLSLNTGKFDTGLLGAKAKMQSLGTELLGKFGAKGLVTMGVVGGFALLAKGAFDFTAEAVKVGMDFDKSMAQVGATMGKSVGDMNGEVLTVNTSMGEFTGTLRDFAQEMGSRTAFSATEAADALNYMALAGYDAKTSMEMLPNVLNLAAAGAMDLGTASDMVTDTQSALGLSTEETTKLVDKMARTSSITNTSVQQLGDAMLRIGGTARTMKGKTTELTAALGLLASAGTKGAEGGTALRNILLNIQGKKFEEAFGAMGVSAYDADGNLRSLKDTFGDMNKAMDGMTQQEKDKILTKVFDRRTLKDANTLLRTNAQTWDEVTGKIDKSKGAAQEMANTQLDNLAGDVTIAKSAFEGLQIAISDKVSPVLRSIVQVGTDAIAGLSQAFKSGNVLEGITTLVTNIGVKIAEKAPLIIPAARELIGKLASGLINAIPKLIEGAAKIIGAFTKSLVSKGPQIAASGIKLVVKLAKAIVTNIPKIIVAVVKLALAIPKNILKAIPKMISSGKKIISEFWTAAKNVLSKLPSKALKLVKEIPEKVGEVVDEMIEAGANLLQGLWDGIKKKWEEFKAWWSEHVGGMGKETRKLLDESSPSKMFREIGYYVSEGFALGVKDGWKLVGDAMDGMHDMVTDYQPDVIDDIGTSKIGGTFEETFSIAIGNAISGMVEDMADSLQSGMERAMENVNITLDKRQFGKMTRKAVAHAL